MCLYLNVNQVAPASGASIPGVGPSSVGAVFGLKPPGILPFASAGAGRVFAAGRARSPRPREVNEPGATGRECLDSSCSAARQLLPAGSRREIPDQRDGSTGQCAHSQFVRHGRVRSEFSTWSLPARCGAENMNRRRAWIAWRWWYSRHWWPCVLSASDIVRQLCTQWPGDLAIDPQLNLLWRARPCEVNSGILVLVLFPRYFQKFPLVCPGISWPAV